MVAALLTVPHVVLFLHPLRIWRTFFDAFFDTLERIYGVYKSFITAVADTFFFRTTRSTDVILVETSTCLLALYYSICYTDKLLWAALHTFKSFVPYR